MSPMQIKGEPGITNVPKLLHECMIGDKLVKVTVRDYEPCCTMSMDLFQKLSSENFRPLTVDIIPIKVGQARYSGQITTVINANGSSKILNIHLKEGHEDFVVLTKKKAQAMGLHKC